MGVLKAKVSGTITLNGKPFNNRTPRDAINNGINIVTEDRKELGLVLGVDIKNNIILSSLDKVSNAGVIKQNEVIKYSDEYFQILKIKAQSSEQQVGRLSGGNQQKVVIAKALMTEPEVLILDEPTAGVDVGAKAEIYQIMERLVKNGMSIIMISSELPEVLAMSDRVVVVANGKITGILDNDGLAQEAIMQYATEE
jgi:D-xylose transport system ATP-binding protein